MTIARGARRRPCGAGNALLFVYIAVLQFVGALRRGTAAGRFRPNRAWNAPPIDPAARVRRRLRKMSLYRHIQEQMTAVAR